MEVYKVYPDILKNSSGREGKGRKRKGREGKGRDFVSSNFTSNVLRIMSGDPLQPEL